jgi:transcriptional regulator with XRE-family HTH domain
LLGLSQSEVANAVGIERTTYNRYERNNINSPNLKVIEKLVALFNIDYNALLGDEQYRKTELTQNEKRCVDYFKAMNEQQQADFLSQLKIKNEEK